MPQDGSIGPNPSVASFRNLSLIILFELIPDLDFNKFMSVECYKGIYSEHSPISNGRESDYRGYLARTVSAQVARGRDSVQGNCSAAAGLI